MIYLDSCILVYAVEHEGAMGTNIRQRLADAGDTVVAISPLVLLECTVGPLRSENLSLYDHYLRASEQFQMLPLGVEEYLRAADLRARNGLRTPDALHLAAAQLSGCDALWTNDARLAKAAHGLAVDVTAEVK